MATFNNAANQSTLVGTVSADTLDATQSGAPVNLLGGLGDDTYLIDSGNEIVTELANAGTDTVISDDFQFDYQLGNNMVFSAYYIFNKLNRTIEDIGALDANGDVAPLRVFQGPKTQLNWPALIFADAEHEELYVANDGDDSILVFREADAGDAAPIRILQGPKTGLKYPSSVYVDTKNDELIVSNMGNHSATVYPRTATGDTAPIRTIRSAPLGKLALTIVNPGGVAYDENRDELLVPN